MNQDFITFEKRLSLLEGLLTDLLAGNQVGPTVVNAAIEQTEKRSQAQEKEPFKYYLSARSYKNMQGIDPDLILIAERAIQLTPFDFAVTEGFRTEKRQAKLRAKGASQVTISKHQLGLAIDIVILINNKASWDFEKYRAVANVFKQAADELKIEGLFWGGDWPRLRDGPHFQLDGRKPYIKQ